MFKANLDELELALLEKRIELLKDQGLTGSPMFPPGDDFFASMKDKRAFDDAMSTIHRFQEAFRNEEVAATLEPPLAPALPLKKKRGRKSKKELAEMQMYEGKSQLGF